MKEFPQIGKVILDLDTSLREESLLGIRTLFTLSGIRGKSFGQAYWERVT